MFCFVLDMQYKYFYHIFEVLSNAKAMMFSLSLLSPSQSVSQFDI